MTSGIKNKKLFVAIGNSQTHVLSDFFWSFVTLNKPKWLDITIMRSRDPWDFIRNNGLINEFLKSDHDYFARMDADQVYPQNYFEAMVPLIDKYKAVGPLLFDRWRSNNFIPLLFSDFGYPRPPVYRYDGKCGVVAVPCPHTNLFFAREVIENIPPPWFEPIISDNGIQRLGHMDSLFIEKIRDAGYKTYINLDVVVGHITTVSVDRTFYERWNHKE